MSSVDTFVPHPRLRNGHVMTVYSWGRRRPAPALPAPEVRYFDVAPGTRVSADCYWQPDRTRHPAILMLHGLEASSSAHYMLGVAAKAYAAGMSAVLLNQRNCGGTEHLGPGLYHAGLTEDPVHVLNQMITSDGIERIGVAGYSLGGNLALKLAGDFGDSAPPALRAICAVSPIVEISRCVHALERPVNVIYQWNFVKDLRARMRRKAAHWPGTFPIGRLRSVRTVRQFDVRSRARTQASRSSTGETAHTPFNDGSADRGCVPASRSARLPPSEYPAATTRSMPSRAASSRMTCAASSTRPE